MIELNGALADEVAGGLSIAAGWSIFNAGLTIFGAWEHSMQGIGATLNNYYGPETTLDIINGGNLGA